MKNGAPLSDTPRTDDLEKRLAEYFTDPEAAKQQAVEEYRQLERELASKQAEIDALMIEYCPDEMTPEQLEEWGKHQLAEIWEKR